MNNLYLVIRQGVYMKGIFGLFNFFQNAKERADQLAKEDVDNYHKWMVVELPFGDSNIDDFFYNVIDKSEHIIYITNKDEHSDS